MKSGIALLEEINDNYGALNRYEQRLADLLENHEKRLDDIETKPKLSQNTPAFHAIFEALKACVEVYKATGQAPAASTMSRYEALVRAVEGR